MKRTFLVVILLFSLLNYAQNISVDSQTYTPQQLIENILIDSDCIENVTITNVSGGDFSGADQSYGFFDATGTTFPFQSGIVMSTGRLQNVPGPNNTLSDDNAPNWQGDADLELALNETNTINATILEFDFTSVASQISFRYIFASEEYQENNPNSCQFSDLFGFLIRPVEGQNQYENIALVPNTNIPVKATTVTPGVPGTCPPQNETYFGSYNDTVSPINFNGQTAILTATANVIPNTNYHVKLVIADEQNFRFDSAVFIEAGSFQLSSDIGPNRLVATANAACEGDIITLNAFQEGASYIWSKDGIPETTTPCISCFEYEVSESGTYNVEVFLDNNCVSFGEITIEYSPLPAGLDSVLIACDVNNDGLTTYNLYDASDDLMNNNNSLRILDFYFLEADAIANINTITNPTDFQNTVPFQILYARIINPANCYDVVELELQTSNNILTIPDLESCDGDVIDGLSDFILNDIAMSIQSQIPTDALVSYYKKEEEAFSDSNPLPNDYINTTIDFQTIFVKVESNNQCFSISTANLVVLSTPLLAEDETIFYCTNTFPETITLHAGVLDDFPNDYDYEWLYNGISTNVNTAFNEVNQSGIYTVIVTAPNSCSSIRDIVVSASSTASIENVSVEGIAPNNTITITFSGDGNYEFALDDINGFYQNSNVFNNIPQGFHTIYIRDLNGCGVTQQEFPVIGFPDFFTPNGDNVNDNWQIIGFNEPQFMELKTVNIFNRYGKLITQLNASNLGWDGNVNGQKLPSDDYWFKAEFLDGSTYTGHFALKR